MRPKPLLLVIIDAFGISIEKQGNPVFTANTPVLDEIEANFPITTLQASGVAVGLPPREAGNSEVGHLTIGSGRSVHHHLPRIISSIHDGSFYKNEKLLGIAEHVKKNNSRLHVVGLVSSGSVHSYVNHLYAILDVARREEVSRVFIHAFSDGKDSPPQEGAAFIKELETRLAKDWPNVAVASVIGRFYAMDRDTKWDRTQKAYDLLTKGAGSVISSIPEYLETSYQQGISDEFIEPAVVGDVSGAPLATVQSNDGLIFFNFREDSMRQITHAFSDDAFSHFERMKIENLAIVTMTDYETSLESLAAFPSPDITNPLAQVLGSEGLTHFHIAETEKYAHVTYFFNGGRETPFEGEERMLIPSPEAAHFDEVPEMRAREITSAILEKMNSVDVVIANFANADMVGHSGNFPAVEKAVEVIDESLGVLMNAVMSSGGMMIITADHGGVEVKRNIISGEKRTEHSINPVPLYIVSNEWRLKKTRTPEEVIVAKKEIGGIITDVAPTILELLEIKKPHEMTGASLVSYLRRQVE
ncbi:MAG: 2,3-bisphosphoglycerate-independent phosphoglycerate mutase [bacterium]|nr:2,3-bisphosphoglycerate-independent phosphoglycerate mutase [bacterium]MDZ4285365.1 2,3-bisphosphoglycerate-independent phosphoglycerate mutase [Candidatus Sungbacteria bacterium]